MVEKTPMVETKNRFNTQWVVGGFNFLRLTGPRKKRDPRIRRKSAKLRAFAHHEGLLRTGMAAAAFALGWLGLDALKKCRWDACHDDALGVETSENVPLQSLSMDSSIKEHAGWYEPTPPFEFRHAMSMLRIEYERYRFIDYGSGKGRVLLLASELPFIEVLGVEVDRQLHNIASRNIAAYPGERMICCDVKSICMNATEWSPPTGPLVVFMFNPFDQIILAPVLRQISAAIASVSQPSYLVYKNPKHNETVLSDGHFSCIENLFGGALLIYETVL